MVPKEQQHLARGWKEPGRSGSVPSPYRFEAQLCGRATWARASRPEGGSGSPLVLPRQGTTRKSKGRCPALGCCDPCCGKTTAQAGDDRREWQSQNHQEAVPPSISWPRSLAGAPHQWPGDTPIGVHGGTIFNHLPTGFLQCPVHTCSVKKDVGAD